MNIAILIDAENVLPVHADQIFEHAASLGEITCKEIFGAGQALTAWVEPVLKYAIHPNLTIKASKGKNSSDIALVIGAMDLLLANAFDTVIIASSDSDFSSLSVRLRNAGINVVGMGTEKANPLWRTACSGFVVLEQHAKAAPAPRKSAPAPAPRQQQKPAQKPAPQSAPQPQQQPQARSAANLTHQERTVIIRAFIQREIEAAGGRLLTNALFTTLNDLPEYKVDQQRSKRRPMNYLMRQFGDTFSFEDAGDGNSYIELAAPDAQAKPDEPAKPEEQAAPVEQPAPVETPEAVAEEATPTQPPVTQAAEPEAEAEGADPLALILAAGVEEAAARQIVEIFSGSADKREAYNKLRKVFGNTVGRDYYKLVKEIAEKQN